MKTAFVCLLAGLISFSFVAANFADDDASPLTVSKNQLVDKIGQTCVVELRIAAVKHSERRKTRFLNTETNFRSGQNVGVAIDDAAFEQFRAAGVDGLEAKFLNRAIRVRGTVIRDENQLLLKVTSPKDIEIVAAALPTNDKDKPAKDAAAELVVINESGKELSLTLPLADLPRHKVETERNEVKETYEGVALADVLEHAGVKLGAEARGELVSRYVLVTAKDNYNVVLAISEVDPFLSPQTILLADRVNGAPLTENDGPLKLIVPNDKRHRRWVRQVAKIEVRQAATGESAPAKPRPQASK